MLLIIISLDAFEAEYGEFGAYGVFSVNRSFGSSESVPYTSSVLIYDEIYNYYISLYK